jgi:hypothetical protein
MKTITFDISDRDYKLLSRLANLRGLTTTQAARELVLESRHTIPAQIRFLHRALRGRGKEQRGRALLDKAAGIVSDDPDYKVPNAESRAAIREGKLMSRLSDLAREVIDGIDLYSSAYDKQTAKKIVKR